MVQFRIRNSRNSALMVSALLLGALVAIGSPPVPAHASDGACADGDGVTVVVDATDVGGSVAVGCAPGDPASGREALESAGFVATDSQPGMICAIDAQPDPCPATFEGSYWAYWSSTADGDWTSYQVGADSSDPVPGEIEGWRYNDGSVGPGIAPADVSSAQEVASSPAAGDEASAAPDSKGADSVVLLAAVVIAVALLALVMVLVVRSRRRQVPPEG